MSKPIINGIDVSECEHFWNKHEALKLELCRINFANNYFSNGIPVAEKCNKHPDCYFKQLKRLQEENEKLKKRQITKNGFICDCEQNAKYKQALEEIREDMEKDTTCESRECGCDDYAECLNCIKETILNKINEVLNDN